MLQLLNYLVINFQTNFYYFNHSEDPTIPIYSFFSLFKKNPFFFFCHHACILPPVRSFYLDFCFPKGWSPSLQALLTAWPQFQPHPPKPELFPFSKYAVSPWLWPFAQSVLPSQTLLLSLFKPQSKGQLLFEPSLKLQCRLVILPYHICLLPHSLFSSCLVIIGLLLPL